MRIGQLRISRFLIVCALVAALRLVPGAAPAHAGGVVGSGTPGSCTEAALNTALAGGGTVTFNCGAAPHTIPFTGQKSISADTTINGGGKITLDGQNAYRLFDVGAVLRLRNIVLARGFFNGDGGAIRNNSNGRLVLENSVIRDSRATLSGGAVLSTGPMTITDSVLEGNQALNGGALYPRFGPARTEIINSVLHHNQATDTTNGWGGAILAWDGAPVTIEGSYIYSNTARFGGGIYNFANSVLALRSNTRLRDNTATIDGGGLYNAGTATLALATLRGNVAPNEAGGGIYNAGTGTLSLEYVSLRDNGAFSDGGGLYNAGVATLDHVTVSGSLSSFTGGGLYNSGTATLTNVTLSGNSTSFSGGGIYNASGTTTLEFVTLSANWARTGGGIFRQGGSLTVKGTIIGNSPQGGDCAGAVTDYGFNLSSDASCGFNPVPNLMLGPLADNGGPTLTHMPQPGSPAIDFVAAGCPPPDSDQRGFLRAADGNGDGLAWCDAGAVEYRVALIYLPVVVK